MHDPFDNNYYNFGNGDEDGFENTENSGDFTPQRQEPVFSADPYDTRDAQPPADTPFDAELAPDEPGGVYKDAGFIAQSEAPVTPRYYNSSQSISQTQDTYDEQPQAEPPRKKKRAGQTATKIIAACLVCLIIGGAGGIFLGELDLFGAGEESQIGGDDLLDGDNQQNDDDSSASSQLLNSVTPEGVLSGTQIAELGCRQTVGITTEITTSYNVFGGMPYTSSVTGSGFVITSDGYILTNYHVIEDAHKGGYDVTVMLYDGETYLADIVGFDEDNDVAVLKIDAQGLDAATLGDSDTMLVGETVYAIGNPLGELSNTVTSGIVSALDREISTDLSSTAAINMFQIDASVNSGNSGGPVYNSYGQVIGIVTAKYSSSGVEGIGFAIPINDAIDIANDLITLGYVSGKPYIGILAETVTQQNAQYFDMVVGAYVNTVYEGTCADLAGLQVGDIITKLDDTDITSYTDLEAAKKDYRAGDTAQLTVYRDGQYLTLQITFDEVPLETDMDTQAQSDNVQQYPYSYGARP